MVTYNGLDIRALLGLLVVFSTAFVARGLSIEQQQAQDANHGSKRHVINAINNLRLNEAQECFKEVPEVCPSSKAIDIF